MANGMRNVRTHERPQDAMASRIPTDFFVGFVVLCSRLIRVGLLSEQKETKETKNSPGTQECSQQTMTRLGPSQP